MALGLFQGENSNSWFLVYANLGAALHGCWFIPVWE